MVKLRKLSVTEINEYAKKLLTYDPILQGVTIEGEISNFVAHSSGHAYFTLKDENSKISCVMFSRFFSHLENKFKNGDQVDCSGDISLYVRDGKFQLYVKDMKLAGLGELHIRFEKLKKTYKEKGYFDENKKKKLPVYPQNIGVITSNKGAAIKDIISVFNRRSTLVNLFVYSVNVQGDYSKDQIVEAINYFNKKENVDLIILSRGGGSIEELWSFNEPEVVETVFFSDIPIISGVGHETDFTLVDFVSDLRAPTPTAAAEVAIKSNDEILLKLENLRTRLINKINKEISNKKIQLEKLSMKNHIISKKREIEIKYNTIDRLNVKINQLMENKIKRKNELINLLLVKLNHNNPIEILNKGYSITKDKDNNVINSIENIKIDSIIETIFTDGKVKSKVIDRKVQNGY